MTATVTGHGNLGARRIGSSFTGTRQLLTVSLRQDLRNILPWVMLVSALSASSVLAYVWIFRDPHQRMALSSTLGANPALSLVFGPAHDLMTADGFNAWRAGQLGALFAGIMAILIVVRNSRANEDSGQAELMASGVLGRQARLAVSVLMAAIASVALGVVCFVLTVICTGGVADTLVLAATLTASGLVFGGVAAVAAQLGSDARTASSLAIAALGIFYVLRGYLDSSNAPGWVTWLTPLGWLEHTKPAAGNNPWPLLLAVGAAVVLVAAAFVLQARRDFGQGMIAPRRGPATGGAVANVWWLAFRLNRAPLISWLIGFTCLGAIFGNLASSFGDILSSNPTMAKIFAAGGAGSTNLTFAFLVTILQIIAIIVSVMGVQIILKIHAEETGFRVEPLLAGSLRRPVYLASNVVVAFVGTAAAMLLAGLFLGLVASATTPSIAMGKVFEQAAATIPAVWVLVGLAVAAVGARPALRLVGWLGVVATFGLTIIGPTFRLWDWAMSISPLHHVPNVAAASSDWQGLGWLSLFVLIFLVIGFVGFRRRDIG